MGVKAGHQVKIIKKEEGGHIKWQKKGKSAHLNGHIMLHREVKDSINS
jgi:hypothetical protein